MNIKKLAPWNWFKKENEDEGNTVPVKREAFLRHGYSGQNPVQKFHQEIDRIFDNAFRGFGISPFESDKTFFPGISNGMLKPMLDLGASETEYTISLEIPGVNEKNVKLELANDTLTIRGEKTQKSEEKDKNFYRLERAYGSFQRVLSLPEDADRDAVKAKFKNGVLTITIPRKTLPKSQGKQIEIKCA